MAPLTNIGQQKTPGRPVEITFAAELGLPSDQQEVLIVGRAASGVASSGLNVVTIVANSGDEAAALEELTPKFGADSEITLAVLAAVRANAGGSTFPPLKVCALDSAASDVPTNAQTEIKKVKAEYIVSPFDAASDTANRTAFRDMARDMSGAQRVHNNQFGTLAVAANQDVTDFSTLPSPDSQFFQGVILPNTGSPEYSDAELAAAAAAVMAANNSPFLGLDDANIPGVPTPENMSDWITVGAGLESEAILAKGWTPLRVKPNGDVSFVRTVTSRLSADGSGTPVVTAYYDVQDFNVLYFFRKAIYTRFSQPDFRRRKASSRTAQDILGEVIRLAQQFEEQGMFQAVTQLAKLFRVERNASDRHRFDVFIPVNVVPNLHVIATNIEAGTQFDSVTI